MYRALLALVSKNLLQHDNKQDKKFHYSSFSHLLRLHSVIGVYKRGVNRGSRGSDLAPITTYYVNTSEKIL